MAGHPEHGVTPAQTHLFGSTDGYRRLARSPDVTDADDAALAALGFGSPRTEEEFALLERELCVAGRTLPSGRYAITRVFVGAPDVAGRRTIERRTLILEMRDWESLAGSDLRTTLRDARNWTREAFVNGEALAVHLHDGAGLNPDPGEAERRVFDALLQARARHRCAVFPNAEPWTGAILHLPSLLPHDAFSTVGWGVGLWSVPTGVSLATLHPNSESRHAFNAATQGPWHDPESVRQLGNRFIAHRPDRSPVKPSRRTPRIGRHVPLLAGLVAMLLASLMVWWAVQQRDVLESSARSGQRPPRDLERDIVHGTQVRPTDTPAETPTPPPAPQAEPPSRDAPVPTPAPAEIPSSSTTSATAPSPASTPAPNRDGFGTTSSAAPNDAFGSGTSEAMREDPAPADMTAAPAPAVATPTPTPAPTPSEKPNIPEAPADNAPWDAEIRLARKAIDLHGRAKEATTQAQGVALVPNLAEHAGALMRAHREIDRTAGKSAPSEKCLILIDARNKKRGLTDLVKREQLAQTFSPLIVQRMLLLSARFEISLAIQDLARRQLIDTGALPLDLRGDAKADGWPDDMPWVLWYFRNKEAPVSTAADGARYMASEFDAALNGHPGTRGAQQVLETIANRAPAGAAP